MLLAAVKSHVLAGFDDPVIGRERWNSLVQQGATDAMFLTWQWQRAWWEAFGRGRLLLIAIERQGQVVAIAPLFSDSGMVFFVGSGGSDYLDFIGDIRDPAVLDAILETARDHVQDFLGFRFYHVLESSPTGQRLKEAADRLGLTCFDEGKLAAPQLNLVAHPEVALAATKKQSLVRHEAFFRREGRLDVRHLRDEGAILAQLDLFFSQHIARWEAMPHPSLFHDPLKRAFYERLTRRMADTGWLRFTRVEWNDRPIAFHFGFCYGGRFMWYKPSFAIDLARRSPGEVLLRQLLLAAIEEGAHTFDFGLGDEPFKRRFATHTAHVGTWGLYPSVPAVPVQV